MSRQGSSATTKSVRQVMQAYDSHRPGVKPHKWKSRERIDDEMKDEEKVNEKGLGRCENSDAEV